MARLTEKQKRFVEEYLVDLNATQAAIRAGYSERTADRIGPELLGKTCVSAEIQRAIQARQKRTEITQDMVLRELMKVAFSNGSDFAKVVSKTVPVQTIGDDGSICDAMDRVQSVELIDTDEIAPDKRAAIAGIKQGKFGIEVSSYDKVKALELLGKHLGMFDARTAQQQEQENNLVERLLGGTEEDIDTDDLPEVE